MFSAATDRLQILSVFKFQLIICNIPATFKNWNDISKIIFLKYPTLCDCSSVLQILLFVIQGDFSFPMTNDYKQQSQTVCIHRKPYDWIERYSFISHKSICAYMFWHYQKSFYIWRSKSCVQENKNVAFITKQITGGDRPSYRE